MADSGKLIKVEKDFSETVDKELPACQELAKVRCKEPVKYSN